MSETNQHKNQKAQAAGEIQRRWKHAGKHDGEAREQVGGWVVGARWVAARSLPEMAGGRKNKRISSRFLPGPQDSTNNQKLLAHQ